jgi:AraC family transcriptional regulator of adaptative response/methylated-DNA-[protein]-cysteine methyltransferase
MLFDLPNHDLLYQALIDQDSRYDGRVFVAVRTTGIFCRLSCPARKPKSENCTFHDTVAACVEAGYRPCKRCRPLATASDHDPTVAALTAALEADPARRWQERDIAAMGFDPSTVRRIFKRYFGITFLDMARTARLRSGFQTLSRGGRVIDAQLEGGFDSGSGFRTAFAKLLGQSPSRFTGEEILRADWIDTPIGPMIAVCDRTNLHLLEFADRKALPTELKRLQAIAKGGIGVGRYDATDRIAEELEEYFKGQRPEFETPLAYHGSPFAKSVWHALRRIPPGATRSYSDIARQIGRPDAVRAVARANGANQIAIVVPCHRVLGADGSLTGYGGGLWRKQRLIDLEGQYARQSQAGKDTRHAASG